MAERKILIEFNVKDFDETKGIMKTKLWKDLNNIPYENRKWDVTRVLDKEEIKRIK